MSRPQPTALYHFTSIDHLPTIIEHGLLCDTRARAGKMLATEVGNRDIKQRRRAREVALYPHGVLADYVPFYFAPRSPMLYVIHKGSVPEYTGGADPLVYLVSSVERLVQLDLPHVYTDRNAVLHTAHFTADPADLDSVIDWELMEARMWADTPDEPDRKERRMAECLVHQHVPWQAFERVVARTRARAEQAQAILTRYCQTNPVHRRRDWYF